VAGLDRRSLLRASLVAGAGIPLGLLDSRSLWASPSPALAIAHYKSSPVDPDGIAEEAKRLTRSSIESLGGMSRFVSRGNTVWVKPNISFDRRPEQAATTNPDVVATLIEMCFQAGAKKVLVSDNPCNEARNTFPRSGIQQAAERAGAQVFFLDERKFRKMAINGKVLKEWQIYQDVVEVDRLINVAIVKNHALSKATLGMKNLMGVTGGARNRFHQDIDNSLADLATFLKPQLTLLDAIRVLMANGPTGGNLADVKRKDTMVAGVDQVAVDAVGATLLGYKPEEIGHIVEANARGLGTINFKSLSPIRLEV
jgi:uncharacterized protein (DUF362 family)